MRKRAGTLRHYRLRVDALEERSLLSAFTVMSVEAPPPTLIVAKGSPVPALPAPGWHDDVAHVIAVSPGSDGGGTSAVAEGSTPSTSPWSSGAAAGEARAFVTDTSGPVVGPGLLVMTLSGRGSLGMDSSQISTSTSPADSADASEHAQLSDTGSVSFAARAADMGGGSFATGGGLPLLVMGHSVSLFQTGVSVSSADSADATEHAQLSDAGSAPDGSVSFVAQPADMGGETYATGGGLPLLVMGHGPSPFNVMLAFPQVRFGSPAGPIVHEMIDPSDDGHPDPNAMHDPTSDGTADVEAQTYQPVLSGQNVLGTGTMIAGAAERDGRDAALVASLSAAGAGPALALRVGATAGQDGGGVMGLELSGTRLAVPTPAVPIPTGEGVVVVAGAAQGAAGAVNVAPGEVPQAQTAEGTALVGDGSPSPHGLGLIDNVLPFDRDTVAAAIDRFFERFDQSGADLDEDREPAALTPPPGVLLLAIAATEAARRHFKRKREEDAAARPRRRDVEGFGIEDSFGSSGPWSSRLS